MFSRNCITKNKVFKPKSKINYNFKVKNIMLFKRWISCYVYNNCIYPTEISNYLASNAFRRKV